MIHLGPIRVKFESFIQMMEILGFFCCCWFWSWEDIWYGTTVHFFCQEILSKIKGEKLSKSKINTNKMGPRDRERNLTLFTYFGHLNQPVLTSTIQTFFKKKKLKFCLCVFLFIFSINWNIKNSEWYTCQISIGESSR